MVRSRTEALSTDFWTKRFKAQARWTKQTRAFIFEKIHLKGLQKALDVGCGTGEIALEIAWEYGVKVHGIDINPDMVEASKSLFKKYGLGGEFLTGNGNKIPYPDNHFDMTYCSFLLLWVDSPEVVVQEMARVTKPKGYVLALAEPDYGGKIDHPEFGLKDLLIDSLKKVGTNPYVGRELSAVFTKAKLKFDLGIESVPWDNERCKKAFEDEWWFLEQVTENWEPVKKKEEEYLAQGLRFSFNPVFYVIGQKK